jgi:hypothetical protein
VIGRRGLLGVRAVDERHAEDRDNGKNASELNDVHRAPNRLTL